MRGVHERLLRLYFLRRTGCDRIGEGRRIGEDVDRSRAGRLEDEGRGSRIRARRFASAPPPIGAAADDEVQASSIAEDSTAPADPSVTQPAVARTPKRGASAMKGVTNWPGPRDPGDRFHQRSRSQPIGTRRIEHRGHEARAPGVADVGPPYYA